ncbi:hypothetical protein ACFLUO_10000 [Chloroflexota bacterium]
MMNNILTRLTISIILLILIVTIPIIGVGCEEEEIQAPSPLPGIALSSTLVPNTDFDVYIYVKQENPTIVPKEFIGATADIAAESLSLWGIPTEDSFTFGGGLTLATSSDAANIHSQILSQGNIWTSLSNLTIYFVQGSEYAADTLKSVISTNDFKNYDDQKALLEVSMFPNSGTTKLVAIAIAKPSKTILKLIARKVTPKTSELLDALLPVAKLEVITAGLYAPQQIDIAEIAKDTRLTSILESDVGILASVKSGLHSALFSTIVDKALDSAGYVKTTLGELTIYKGSLDAGNGKLVPILLRVEGNRIFAAISGTESYVETLITSVNM